MSAAPPSQAAGPPRKIIIDCDPGIDDALALTFACGHPGLDLSGVTTVAGNVSLARTTGNALAVLGFLGRGDVPVVAGSPGPLLGPEIDASRVHGVSGLGSARLPPAGLPRPGHAADFLIDRIGAAPGEVTLIATGPLTNIALAVRREPRIVSQVAAFVIMGGSAGRGNVTPAAEFNIACDPEAAAIVFRAGWQVTMAGLDVTLQARATAGIRERMRGLGRLGSDLLLPVLAGYQADADPALLNPAAAGHDPPVHDLCAVALVAEPGVFGCHPARVDVETAGRYTAGMTVTSFRAADPNAMVALSIDTGRFWDLVLGAFARVAPARA